MNLNFFHTTKIQYELKSLKRYDDLKGSKGAGKDLFPISDTFIKFSTLEILLDREVF